MHTRPPEVVTVTPNPAIDWTLTVPDFAAGKVNRVEQQRSRPAGKGVNVAAALADYGHHVAVTGFLGRDNARPFEEFFAQKGIADHFIRIAGATRVGIKVADPARQETTDINFPGPAPGAEDLPLLSQQLERLAAEARPAWCALSGSLPPGVPATLYRDLLLQLQPHGHRVVLDASGDALRHGLEAAPQVIKPNLHELETLVGRSLPSPEAVVEAVRTLPGSGTELAVVSMGADGALFIEQGASERRAVVLAHPPTVEVRSTVGAGDAMVAGIIAGRLAGLPLPELARLATAFSLHALTHDEEGIPPRARIEALAREVAVDVVEG